MPTLLLGRLPVDFQHAAAIVEMRALAVWVKTGNMLIMIWRYRFSDAGQRSSRADYASAAWASGLSAAHVELMAMLPGTDINGALWSALGRGGDGSCIAALLLVDPFLRVSDCCELLRSAGISEVVNIPTVRLFEAETRRALEDTGYGWKQEVAQLTRFKDAGFAINVVVRNKAGARDALKLEARRLIVHPGFPPVDPVARRAALKRAAELCRSLGEDSCPVSLYSAQGYQDAEEVVRGLKAGSVALQSANP